MTSTYAPDNQGTAVTVVPPPQRNTVMLRPIAPPQEILIVQNETRELIEKALEKDRDYGLIPGVKKPSLYKAGAERVTLAFGCVPRFTIIEKEIDHDRRNEWTKTRDIWEGPKGRRRKTGTKEESGTSFGLYRYVIKCELVYRESGDVVGEAIGSCSTMENKYIDRPRDLENTVLKMAEKRAYVGATLLTFGLSDQFTQDVEDTHRRRDSAPPPVDDESAIEDGYSGHHAPSETANGPAAKATDSAAADDPACPTCGGRMWDNRLSKRNPKAPDYKCRSMTCDGVLWAGQWPPKPPAKPEQVARIEELLNSPDLDVTEDRRAKLREKVAKRIASPKSPFSEEGAAETIAYLEKLIGETHAAEEEPPPPQPQPQPLALVPTSAPDDGLPF